MNIMLHFLVLTAVSIILFQPIQSQVTITVDDLLQDQNFLNYVPILLQPPPIPQNVSQKCALQLNQFYRGLNNTERWALEMFDSWSKMQSGILRGNIVDLGNFDECLKVKHVEITGKYCLISLDPAVFTKATASEADDLTAQYGMNFELQKGICIPDSCSVEDIELWLSDYTKGGIKLNDDLCQSVFTTPKLHWDSILAICVLGIIALTAVVCSILDLLRPQNHPIVKAFSVPTNAGKLFRYSDDPNKLKFVDGLKTLSMAWIIFGHGYLLLIDEPLSNYSYALEIFEKLPVMTVISGTLSVDTFLIISGFLLSYSIMKIKSKASNISIIPAAIFHRYLRLTPLLAVVVMIHATLFPFFGSGPVYPRHKQLFVENCQHYWWSALLYMQNFINSRNMCVPQSWYLSVDMQLYVLCLFLMILLKKKLKLGAAVIVGLILVSLVASFVISWVYDLPGSIAGFAEDRNNKEFMPKYYYQSYTRMAPYLMGLLLGYLVHHIKVNGIVLKMRPPLILCIWIINLGVLITCVFAGHESVIVESHDRISNSFYLTFRRPAWSLAVGWVIFACSLDFGGFINSILSLPVFEVFSRLSYGMYLVHYAVIQLRYLSTRNSIDLGVMDQNLRFWGFFAASALVAAIFSLLFESPIIALEKIIFQRNKSAKSKISKEANEKV